MVNIYLKFEHQHILLLSVPFSDIQRLTLRPIKWLRFVTFAICGVHGDLSATPNGPAADYDNITLASPIAEAYYYTPEGDYRFIDYNGLNDIMTSSERSSRFRSDVMARDGSACVFTAVEATLCDAAHLLPKSKGDEYIGVVFEDRRNLYDTALEPANLDINSVENGMMLRKDLHASFAVGNCAFLKTPNFALDPTDIPRVVDQAQVSPSRITLHHLKPATGRDPTPQYDAHMAGTSISPPSTLVLDYMYGITAYHCWGSGQETKEVMHKHFTDHYKSIPMPPASLPSSDRDSSPETDDLNDNTDRHPQGRKHSLKMSHEMLKAMDDVLMISMLIKGRTPEMIASERQKQQEVEELHAEEAGRVKVQQWMQSLPCVPLTSGSH